MSPSGTSVVEQVADEPVQAAWRDARRGGGCRRARRGRPAFFSTISCAMRTSVRRMSSSSRTTFGWVIRVPSWPLWTGLKGRGWNLAARADAQPVTLASPSARWARSGSGPCALEVGEQPLVVLGHAIERPGRLELEHEQPHLPRERRVGALDAAGCGRRRRARRGPRSWASTTALHGGSGCAHTAAIRRTASWTGFGSRPPWRSSASWAASSSSAVRSSNSGRSSAGASRATLAPRFGSIATSPSAASARSAARSEWRGDAVGLGELELAQPLARRQLAVEDARAQRGGERVDGRDAVRARAVRSCRRRSRGRGRAERAARARAARRARARRRSPRPRRVARRARATPRPVAVSGSASVSVAVSPGRRARAARGRTARRRARSGRRRGTAPSRARPALAIQPVSPSDEHGQRAGRRRARTTAAMTRSGAWPRRSSRLARIV